MTGPMPSVCESSRRPCRLLGEVLSPTDLLWLFYQSDLDPSAELSYAAFARAIATLKRARIERAPFWRWMPAKFRDWKEFMGGRGAAAHKKLVAQQGRRDPRAHRRLDEGAPPRD